MDKIVLYGKWNGEACCPLTVRIEWLPDGTIKPLMYWTPDGTLFRVTANIGCTRIEHLKDGGEGMRFKVMSEIIDTPEPRDGIHHSHYEMYLYLADRRFSEKNIIDDRYKHPGKEYISVTLDVFPDGDYKIIYFWVAGARYAVEKTIAVEPRSSFHAGGTGVWHKVEARLVSADNDLNPQKSSVRTSAVYWELNKWFVSMKSSSTCSSLRYVKSTLPH